MKKMENDEQEIKIEIKNGKYVKYITTVTHLLLLTWFLLGVYFVWQAWQFEQNHSLTIQNRLTVQDRIAGRSLQQINYETYENYFNLMNGVVVPFLVMSLFVFILCFSLSELKFKLFEKSYVYNDNTLYRRGRGWK